MKGVVSKGERQRINNITLVNIQMWAYKEIQPENQVLNRICSNARAPVAQWCEQLSEDKVSSLSRFQILYQQLCKDYTCTILVPHPQKMEQSLVMLQLCGWGCMFEIPASCFVAKLQDGVNTEERGRNQWQTWSR